MLFFLFHMLFFNKVGEQEGSGLHRFCLEAGVGESGDEVVKVMYTHVSKCKKQ
jgi:stress response protein SCP2